MDIEGDSGSEASLAEQAAEEAAGEGMEGVREAGEPAEQPQA